VKFDKKKPVISMISVGGTITSKIDYRTGAVTTLNKPRDILQNVSEVTKFTNIKSILSPFNIMSESMNHTHWRTLARECKKELDKINTRGVILTHGTDTLHFTSAALSFFLRGLGKPVVITGSQRSTDRGSSDGGMNIICSSYTALSDIAEVGICMHGTINDDYCLFSRGTHVRKMNTERRDAFRPINEYPLAKVWPDGKIQVKNRKYNKRNEKRRVELDTKFEPRVAMLQAYPGSDPGILDYLIKKGYRGFVVQATGLGQVPIKTKSWLPVIKRSVDSGIPVFLTPQTLYGRLNNNVYSEGRALLETGVIPLGDMLSETAYVKLGWVLGHTKDPKKVREMMTTNYAGEMTSRTLVGTFLY
jgi:glutamyl-tRNA(Gln) amidotransferase subunit D